MVRKGTHPNLPGFTIYDDGRIQRPSGVFVKLNSYAGAGYKVFKGPNRVNYYVHRVVCEVFSDRLGNPLEVVRHLDGDKTNNAYNNLAWGTAKDNSQDMIRHGNSTLGESNPQAKLTWDKVSEIRNRPNDSGVTLAAEFGISTATVSLIRNNKIWKVPSWQ